MRFSLQSLLLSFVVIWSAMAAFDLWGIVFAIVLIIGAAYVRAAKYRSQWVRRLCILAAALALFSAFSAVLGGLEEARESSRSGSCRANVHNVALALQGYHEINGCFPPAYTHDANGKPMHSWRVLLLPYLDFQSLYNKYDLNEPWDSPNNRNVAAAMSTPREYVCPSDPQTFMPSSAYTSYVAVVGPGTAWPGDESIKRSDLPDGGRHTIMVVEARNSGIQWMEPRDLSVEEACRAIRDAEHGAKGDYFHYDQHGSFAAFADGKVRVVSSDTLADVLTALLTTDGSEGINDVMFDCFTEPRLHWGHITALLVLAVSYAVLLFRPRRRNLDTPPKEEPLSREGPTEE